MKVRAGQKIRKAAILFCVAVLLVPGMAVHADELDKMEKESSDLKTTLDDINEELMEIGIQIAETEAQISLLNGKIEQREEQLAIARENEKQQYEDMKLRIQYIYENQGESMLGMILGAESLADFVNRVDFVSTVSEYDRNKVDELKALRTTIEEEETTLKEQQASCAELKEELQAEKEELTRKAETVSADLNTLSAKIETLKSEEAARILKEAQEAASRQSGTSAKEDKKSAAQTSNGTTGSSTSQGTASSGSGYIYPSGPGQLNPWVGVVYYNGHRETYYSQKVLPGVGLNIPGRHIAQDGTIRDGNGYLCLASSDHPRGTVVETSLGTGIVYDSGCASGTIDIYTDW